MGGSNPSKILTPPVSFNAAKPFVNTGFKIYVFNANLNCVPTKPFPCATYVEVYLVKASVTSASIPAQADIYTSAPIQVINANAVNFSYFANPPIPNGAQYRVLFDFKTSLNCNQPNTKYILDEFSVLETGGGPLPVRFSSFTANQYNGKVMLKWQTASEINSKEFEVQRKTASGTYQTIFTVPSKAFNGNSGTPIEYTYDDAADLSRAGLLYYRIKQVDFDAKANYSEIRSIRNNVKKFSIIIYPNPGRDARITIPESIGPVDISVTDIAGKEVRRWNNSSLRTIPVTSLTPGMYGIKVNVRETGDVVTGKLLIQ